MTFRRDGSGSFRAGNIAEDHPIGVRAERFSRPVGRTEAPAVLQQSFAQASERPRYVQERRFSGRSAKIDYIAENDRMGLVGNGAFDSAIEGRNGIAKRGRSGRQTNPNGRIEPLGSLALHAGEQPRDIRLLLAKYVDAEPAGRDDVIVARARSVYTYEEPRRRCANRSDRGRGQPEPFSATFG